MNPIIPLLAVIGVFAITVAINELAMARRKRKDTGDIWTRVLVWSSVPLVLLLPASWVLELAGSSLWEKGFHLVLDRGTATSIPAPALVALGVPLAIWGLAVLGFGFLREPKPAADKPFPGRWLAGSAGFVDNRRWILWPAGWLLLVAATGIWDLGVGAHVYPAAVWAMLLVAGAALAGVALSRRTERVPRVVTDEGAETNPARRDWVKAMQGRGFKVRTLYTIQPFGSDTRLQEGISPTLVEEWEPLLKQRRVAPELIDTLARMVDAGDALSRPSAKPVSRTIDRLILGPDDCGQEEMLAVAALLGRQRELVTLVVVPGPTDDLRERLQALPGLGSGAVTCPAPREPIDEGALIWLVSAETLSVMLNELVRNPVQFNRVGLAVWWDLHEYSGVLAANCWAISHRFKRLAHRRARPHLMTLAFARNHPFEKSELRHFVGQLLPYDYTERDAVTVVEPYRRGRIHIHLLEADNLRPPDELNPRDWDPSLIATRESVVAGWPTYFNPPAELDRGLCREYLAKQVDGLDLGRRLESTPASAGARVLEARPDIVLSLAHLLSQLGRLRDDLAERHVGLLLPENNPYLRHLLTRMGEQPEQFFRETRRLVPGVPKATFVGRHLLLALREMEAVDSDLLATFQDEHRFIDEVIAELEHDHLIERHDRRYLNDDRIFVRETGYEPVQISEIKPMPLDTVGKDKDLLPLRAPTMQKRPELRRIDPERATILAYPGRVFRERGDTFKVENWRDLDQVTEDGAIRCQVSNAAGRTWRIVQPHIDEIELVEDEPIQFLPDTSVSRSVVGLVYAEEVSGVYALNKEERSMGLDPVVSRPMATRALYLRFVEDQARGYPLALHSIAQSLRHVLSVHVGIDEDAMAVVAVEDQPVGGMDTWGIMIVDLYPSGIGLVDAVRDANLLKRLLMETLSWLEGCACKSADGCSSCVRSPSALAASHWSMDEMLNREQAIGLLREVLSG